MVRFALRLPLLAPLALALCLALAAPGLAAQKTPAPPKPVPSDFVTAYQAFLAGDLATAHRLWLALAERGDIDAAFNLAALYDNGYGVPADIDKATRWYRRAAERKLSAAEVALARIAREKAASAAAAAGATPAPRDPTADPDFRALRKAAEGGAPEAQFALASAYDRGIGVIQNYSTAAAWYQRAAEQGLVAAQYNLATLYDDGLGVQNDIQQAILWYGRAAEAGSPLAANNLGYLYEFGIGVAQNDAAALAWYRRGAEAGLDVAQNNLAVMLQLGRGAPRGFEEAGRWYRAAAEQGHGEAMVNLAVLLANGFGVERDAVEAYAWLARAARMANEKLAARAEALRADLAGRLGEKEAGRAAELAASFVPKPNKTTLITRGEGRPQPRGVGGFGELWLAAQRYLALLGLYDGAVDGAAGPKARAAVLSFVRRGAPKAKTATLSPELLARLAFAWEASTTAPAAP